MIIKIILLYILFYVNIFGGRTLIHTKDVDEEVIWSSKQEALSTQELERFFKDLEKSFSKHLKEKSGLFTKSPVFKKMSNESKVDLKKYDLSKVNFGFPVKAVTNKLKKLNMNPPSASFKQEPIFVTASHFNISYYIDKIEYVKENVIIYILLELEILTRMNLPIYDVLRDVNPSIPEEHNTQGSITVTYMEKKNQKEKKKEKVPKLKMNNQNKENQNIQDDLSEELKTLLVNMNKEDFKRTQYFYKQGRR